MPSNVLAFSRMKNNAENKIGKNWTKEELKKREAASEALKRETVDLVAPAWLMTEYKKRAFAIWQEITAQAAEIELFDNVDAGILAMYCDIVAQYEEAAAKSYPDARKTDRLGKLALAYSEKLGLTPTSRARLALKRAAEPEPTGKEDLFD